MRYRASRIVLGPSWEMVLTGIGCIKALKAKVRQIVPEVGLGTARVTVGRGC